VSPLGSERRRLEHGIVEILTVDRPQRLNAIDAELLDALAERVAAIAATPQVGAVIVTGAGTRAFSAGADVSRFAQLRPLDADALMARGQRAFAALEALPQPTIAAVNGYALGGGLELALACDLRLMAASAQVGQPEITLANVPGWGATQRLPRIVGEAAAKDLILTGRLLDAAEARRIGLVHQVCERDELMDRALGLADLTIHRRTGADA
jgi:enoyl-CoA hydratase/carnithine racemase